MPINENLDHRRAKLALWLGAAALLVLTWSHIISLVADSHSRELAGVERDLANLTRVSQEHANRTLRSADQVIRFIQSRYLEIGDRLDLGALTSKGVIDTEIFNQVGVIDANGIYVLSNLPIKGRLDLSDRAHFKVHVAADTGELFISQPILGRASGKWSIQLTRRITRPDGQFAGVVVVSIDPGYFTRFYAELNLGAQGLSAIYGLDGVARARKVGPKEEFGTAASAALMFTRLAQGELAGSYQQRSVVDGIERKYFYRKVPHYPLIVSAGLDMQDLLANHRKARDALLLQAALLSLLILALATALTRHLRQLRQAMAARQLAQRQVQDRTEQLNAIFTMSPDGFVSFDQHRCVKYVNPAFTQMTAPGAAALEGMNEQDFSAWLLQRCSAHARFIGIEALRHRLAGKENPERELIEISHPAKRILEVGLRASSSSTVSQILYFRDVTHEVEVDQMKSEFLSTAAHELRTPMASVFGFTEVLLTQQLDATTQRESLGIIYEQSRRMATILNELLDLARIEERRGKDFRYTGLCLQELLTQLVKGFKPPEQRSAPELLVPTLAVHVMADNGKLQQAILNVLTNAYKYSAVGSTVTVQIVQDHDQDPARADRVCIQITDHGIGMTPEQLLRVGERFYRADASGKVPGTGLGMSIAREIMALHRGSIKLDSTFGQGTRVSLCLPMHLANVGSGAAGPNL
jgi:signal transduction histidine kinase